VPRSECEDAAQREGFQLVAAFFPHQQRRMAQVQIRRLILAPPVHAVQATATATATRKRKAPLPLADAGGRASVSSCGATFGATMGNIVGYLEGRSGPRGERARILRGVHAQLADAAGALGTMDGDDTHHLARGLAACRVVAPQRNYVPELAHATCPRIDSKYGHAGTAVGTTATLIAIFGVMCEVPPQCEHIARDESFIKAMRCAAAALAAWSSPSMQLRTEHWRALAAEHRALERAIEGAREATRCSSASMRPAQRMALQLAWARRAAYPPHECVDETTHRALRDRVRDRSLFAEWCESRTVAAWSAEDDTVSAIATPEEWALVSPPSPPLPVAPLPGARVVPLSEIRLAGAGDERGDGARDDDDSSDVATSCGASSSWQTAGCSVSSSAASLASAASSAGSRASRDSLDEVLGAPMRSGMVLRPV